MEDYEIEHEVVVLAVYDEQYRNNVLIIYQLFPTRKKRNLKKFKNFKFKKFKNHPKILTE